MVATHPQHASARQKNRFRFAIIAISCTYFPLAFRSPPPPAPATSSSVSAWSNISTPECQLFRIRGVAADYLTDYLNRPLADDLIETALRLGALEQWQPFDAVDSGGLFR